MSNKIYGLIGSVDLTTSYKDIAIITENNFEGSVESYLCSSKAANSLKIVGISPSILKQTVTDLSNAEIKAINLAKALIENKSYLVFNYYEKSFTNKEKSNYARLFKKLVTEYNKTILIYTNDLTFIWNIADEIINVDNDKVINTYSKQDYYKISSNTPEIAKIISYIRAKGIKIDDYKEVSDLLKSIYRIKESKNEVSNKY